MNDFDKARELLKEFKGPAYLFGNHVLKDIGSLAASIGNNAVLVYAQFPGVEEYVQKIHASLEQAGVHLVTDIQGARPNAPREDLFRITDELKALNPDLSLQVLRFRTSADDYCEQAVVLGEPYRFPE